MYVIFVSNIANVCLDMARRVKIHWPNPNPKENTIPEPNFFYLNKKQVKLWLNPFSVNLSTRPI